MNDEKSVPSGKQKNMLAEVKAIKIFSVSFIFSAAAVASSLVFIFIPNLETLSVFFFLVGYRYGIKTGMTTVITSVTIYEMFASQFYGTGGLIPFMLKFPPFFLIVFFGAYFNALKINDRYNHEDAEESFIDNDSNHYSSDILYQPFDLQKKTQVIHFSLYERFLLAQLGFVLTVIFDLVTTLGIIVFVPTWEGLLVSFITGFPFFTFHQLTNIILFSTIPSILVAINKAGPTI
ncbi:MAG: hypothetical protein ACW964_13305 [Candidatus Hodarchaeales archaeon]|jgi:hypothetical protein